MKGFIPLLLLILLVAVLLRVNFIFTVVYFLAAIYILSRLWVRRASRNLRVERNFSDRAFRNDLVEVTLRVRNNGWLPIPWLRITESMPVQLVTTRFQPEAITLGPYDSKEYRYTLHCRERGYYRIGPLVGEGGDLLGLESRVITQFDPDRLIVYPRVVSLERLGLPTSSPLVSLPARSRLYEDPSRIMGVRDYQRGDSLRRIHWSASARAQHLVVKQYQPAIARETVVFLDLNSTNYELRRRFAATEMAITVAASIASHVITREGLPIGLVTEASDPLTGERVLFDIPPRSERAHLVSNILEVLARVQTVSEGDFPGTLQRHSAKLSWGATVVAITGQGDESLLRTLLHMQRSGFVVSLLIVREGVLSGEQQELSSIARVPARTVWDDEDLEVLA